MLDIIGTVRKNGDEALFDYTLRFDNVEVISSCSQEEFDEAKKIVPQDFIDAVRNAHII